MKNQKRVCAIAFSVLYILILLGEIAIIILKQYTASLYLLFPALLLVPIYLTFTRVPKETNYHVFHLILLILLRYLLIAIALLLPVLFTKKDLLSLSICLRRRSLKCVYYYLCAVSDLSFTRQQVFRRKEKMNFKNAINPDFVKMMSPEFICSMVVMLIVIVFSFVVYFKQKKVDPLEKPHGIVGFAETIVEFGDNKVSELMGCPKYFSNFAAYVIPLYAYIFIRFAVNWMRMTAGDDAR